jgi:hypothetical protein
MIFVSGAVFSIGQGVLELTRSRGEGAFGFVYGTLVFSFVAGHLAGARDQADAQRDPGGG